MKTPNKWKVTLRRSSPSRQVTYFTTNPQGGGFGSNTSTPSFRHSEGIATRNIPAGDEVTVECYTAGRLTQSRTYIKA